MSLVVAKAAGRSSQATTNCDWSVSQLGVI